MLYKASICKYCIMCHVSCIMYHVCQPRCVPATCTSFLQDSQLPHHQPHPVQPLACTEDLSSDLQISSRSQANTSPDAITKRPMRPFIHMYIHTYIRLLPSLCRRCSIIHPISFSKSALHMCGLRTDPFRMKDATVPA